MDNKLIKSFKNSLNGLKLGWTEDHSFRTSYIQVGIGIAIATALALHQDLRPYEWLILVASMIPIAIVETINTAIEAVTDKASPEKHPLAKKAKDIGSAAVLITRIFSLICWLTVLFVEVD